VRNRQKRLKEVPNQALYQAEPQPELIVSPARQRSARPYFAYFETPGKKLSQATSAKSVVPGKSNREVLGRLTRSLPLILSSACPSMSLGSRRLRSVKHHGLASQRLIPHIATTGSILLCARRKS
jgi:hypothetical protein